MVVCAGVCGQVDGKAKRGKSELVIHLRLDAMQAKATEIQTNKNHQNKSSPGQINKENGTGN